MNSMLVIPLFIPHSGCPHDCLFCNQQKISGKQRHSGGVGDVASTIEEWLARKGDRQRIQVAFFGGSFTCLPETEQDALLSAVTPYLAAGKVESIRLSTRPDCIDETICERLQASAVKVVELGAQSLNDQVLLRSLRGHTVRHIREAVAILKERAMEVGLQLMPGLPGETSGSFLRGIDEVIRLRPDFVRLYPTLVVRDSGLAELYRTSRYRPLSLHKAVALTARCCEKLTSAGIAVIRMGLQPSVSLAESIIAGPYHPAFGELVQSRLWYRKMRARLAGLAPAQKLDIHISFRDMSAVVGMNRQNIKRLDGLGYAGRFTIVANKEMARGSMTYVVG